MALVLSGDGTISGANLNIDSDGAASFAGLTVDTNTLHVDAASNSVAVGRTDTSFGKFTVSGGYAYINEDGTNTRQLYLRSNIGDNVGPAIQVATNHGLSIYTSNQQRVVVDTAGRVTIPNQPAWNYVGGTVLVTGSYVTIKPSTAVIASSDYNTSTGLFTAPVAGKYYMGVWGLMYPTDNSVATYLFFKNGTTYGQVVQHAGHLDNNHDMISASMVFSLSANDTIGFQILRTGGSANAYNTQWNQFGYLIG